MTDVSTNLVIDTTTEITTTKKVKKTKKTKKKTKKPKRCQHNECKKKLSLVDLTCVCKCNKYFCPLHRMCEKHHCEYDFEEEKKRLYQSRIDNMKCVASKMEDKA